MGWILGLSPHSIRARRSYTHDGRAEEQRSAPPTMCGRSDSSVVKSDLASFTPVVAMRGSSRQDLLDDFSQFSLFRKPMSPYHFQYQAELMPRSLRGVRPARGERNKGIEMQKGRRFCTFELGCVSTNRIGVHGVEKVDWRLLLFGVSRFNIQGNDPTDPQGAHLGIDQ